MITATAGQPEVWSDKWRAIGQGENACLYTPHTPRTQHQAIQRAYFLDLFTLALPLPWHGKYVEFGAGRGTTSMYLASRGFNVTMLDLSQEGFSLCNRNCDAAGLARIKQRLADVRNSGLPNGFADCVFSIGLLEHFNDAECRNVLAEMYRVLKPGGLLFGTACHTHEGERDDCDEFARTPEQYTALARGLEQELACQPYQQLPGVYRLVSWKL